MAYMLFLEDSAPAKRAGFKLPFQKKED